MSDQVGNQNVGFLKMRLIYSPETHEGAKIQKQSNKPCHEKICFAKCENRAADQLRSNHTDDQRLCCSYIDGKSPSCPKSEIPSILPSSVTVQPSLSRTWSDTLEMRDFLVTGFLVTAHIP